MSKEAFEAVVSEVYGLKPVPGDIGIELEVEGDHVPFDSKYWFVEEEGSLRHGFEYILKKPLSLKEVPVALKELKKNIDESSFEYSIRTSTHIHVNASRLTIREVYNVLGFYYLVEDILVRTQGPLRIGNLFCLRMSDAEMISTELLRSIYEKTYFNVFYPDGHKYSALNLATLRYIGSLEFRFFRPMTDVDLLYRWCKILYKMIDRASKIPIGEHIRNAEEYDYSDFMRTVFDDDDILFLRNNLGFTDMAECISENIDYMKELSYCIDEIDGEVLLEGHMIPLDIEKEKRVYKKKTPGELADQIFNPISLNTSPTPIPLQSTWEALAINDFPTPQDGDFDE